MGSRIQAAALQTNMTVRWDITMLFCQNNAIKDLCDRIGTDEHAVERVISPQSDITTHPMVLIDNDDRIRSGHIIPPRLPARLEVHGVPIPHNAKAAAGSYFHRAYGLRGFETGAHRAGSLISAVHVRSGTPNNHGDAGIGPHHTQYFREFLHPNWSD